MDQTGLAHDSKLLHLNQLDNVAVLMRDARKGEIAVLDTLRLTLPCDLALGHKLAIRMISKGEDIIKYGVPIGYASMDIAKGEHVHLHNIKSRYTAIDDMDAGQT